MLFHDQHEDEVNASRIAKMGKRLLELDGEVENGGENGAARHHNTGQVDRTFDVLGRSIVQLWSCAVKSRHGFCFVATNRKHFAAVFEQSSRAFFGTEISEHDSGPLLQTVNKTLLAFLELLPRRLRR